MDSKGVTFEGKTLDDAVRKGLDALGLSRAEVMITVMEEGSSGFLGIGSRPYKVRMMPRPRRELVEREERGDAAVAETAEAVENARAAASVRSAEPAVNGESAAAPLAESVAGAGAWTQRACRSW